MKTYAGFKHINKAGAGRPVYVRNESYDVFADILKGHRNNYHFTTIMRTIYLLNADSQRGMSLNTAGDAKAIKSGNVGMRYDVHDGAVFIQKLTIAAPKSTSKTGLYKVSWDTQKEGWFPSESPIESLDANIQWQSDGGKAHYAAVAGRFDDHEAAADRLPAHIIGAYQKANMLTTSGAGTSYSMFWNQKGAHKSAESGQSLASIMQQSTKNNLPVNWLIHGEGIHTFTNAAKILKTSPLASAGALNKNPNAGKVANQNVYFSNPASSAGEKSLKELCEQAGVTFKGYNANNRDLRRWSTVKNVGREMGKPLASLAMGGGITAAAASTLGAGGFDKAVSTVVNGLSSGNYAMITGGVVAGGLAVVGGLKKAKVIAAGVKCTFGSGNEQWYTDDKALRF